MIINTKFSLGDTVWAIRSSSASKIVACLPCKQQGTVELAGEKLVCPKCHGRSAHPQYAGQKWFIYERGIVGQIQTRITDTTRFYERDERERVQYMLDITGVGSGQLWEESDLYGSEEEAQVECDKRNGILKLDDEAEEKEALL